MNKYLQQFKNGNYSFQQFIEIVKTLGFSAVGFVCRYYIASDEPKVYYIEEDSSLRPDEGVTKIRTYDGSRYKDYKSPSQIANCFFIPAESHSHENKKYYCKNKYGFADENGNVYETVIEFVYRELNNDSNYYNYSPSPKTVDSIKIKTRKLNNMQFFEDKHFLNSQEELAYILNNNNIWLKKFADDKNIVHLEYLLMAPYIETLYKANFAFMQEFVAKISQNTEYNNCHYWYNIDQGWLDKINRLCQQGKSPKEIFKAPKELYEALKSSSNLDVWDHLRVMCKMDNLSPECALLVLEQNYSDRDLRMIRGILNKEYQGKKVFSFETLANYLHRLDMHEAIDRWEALEILEDYLRMCNQLQMEPKIDGDSLKREHDIAARLCRQQRNERFNAAIAKRCEELSKYDWYGDTYFIRAIQNQEDLIDEARQQHNCVAGYASSIAAGNSNIFVCRRVSMPELSLVTVELSTTCREIRQKYMAYNKPIYNKELTEFLDVWLEHCRQIKDAESDCASEK